MSQQNTVARQAEESGQNSDITINTEILKERKDSYMSLSDLYQITIFTNQAFSRAEELKADQEQQDQILRNSVFIKPMLSQETKDLQSLLFTETVSESKKQDYMKAKSGLNSWYLVILIVISLFFIIGLQQYNYVRKKRRDHYVNEFDLEASPGTKN